MRKKTVLRIALAVSAGAAVLAAGILLLRGRNGYHATEPVQVRMKGTTADAGTRTWRVRWTSGIERTIPVPHLAAEEAQDCASLDAAALDADPDLVAWWTGGTGGTATVSLESEGAFPVEWVEVLCPLGQEQVLLSGTAVTVALSPPSSGAGAWFEVRLEDGTVVRLAPADFADLPSLYEEAAARLQALGRSAEASPAGVEVHPPALLLSGGAQGDGQGRIRVRGVR